MYVISLLKRMLGINPVKQFDATVPHDEGLTARAVETEQALETMRKEVSTKVHRVKELARVPSPSLGILNTMGGALRMVGDNKHD